MKPVVIAGGGLAGSEAAWQLAERGVAVTLFEMRPARPTPAHKTDRLAELVCSNSLKSNSPGAASWLLKEELRRAGSLLLRIAGECAVPGGSALAVDRERFAEGVTAAVSGHPLITLRREELREIPTDSLALIATGPLTSDALAARLEALTGSENLAFYDAISPVVDAETLNMERIFPASRYGKGGGEDYLNCPFTEDEYRIFYEALESAETVQAHEFENVKFFEACLPIEELGRRGYDTLRFGPMKPVGLIDPRTGRQPFAVVQLRAENLRFSSYNLVGFQNHLKFPEQKRIMRLDSGSRERGVPATRADSSQHLYQCAAPAESGSELSRGARGFRRGSAFGRRGVRRMHCDGAFGWQSASDSGAERRWRDCTCREQRHWPRAERRSALRTPTAHDSPGVTGALHHSCCVGELPAREHFL